MPTESFQLVDPDEAPGSKSLQKRAQKRKVHQIDERVWMVEGDDKLNDQYPEYLVALPEGQRKYRCSCHEHAYGGTRARKLCSHVLAVILCRKGKKEYESIHVSESSAGPAEAPESEVEPRRQSVRGSADSIPATSDDSLLTGPAEETQDATGSEPELPKSVVVAQQLAALPDLPPAVDHPMFGSEPWPEKIKEFRQPQWAAIKEAVEAFHEGVKVVMIDAPTGSGKTVMGEAIRRLLTGHLNTPYVVTTKSLQDQIAEDFHYARVIKGRTNYRTILRPDLTTDDCDGSLSEGPESCSWCPNMHQCPYRVAKEEAATQPLGVLNVAFYLNEVRLRQSAFKGRRLVVIDEADTAEEQVRTFYEVPLSARMRNQIGVDTVPKKTVAEDWQRWLRDEVGPAIKDRLKELTAQGKLFDDQNVQQRRTVKQLQRLDQNVHRLLQPVTVPQEFIEAEGEEEEQTEARLARGWVMTGLEGRDANPKDRTIVFKPVRVHEIAPDALWATGQRFLMMSATTISFEQQAANLGLEDHEWEGITVPSSFPTENRPVIVEAPVKVTFKTKDTAYPKIAEKCQEIMDEYPNVRILIHTVSYQLGRYLWDNLDGERLVTYYNSGERERALKRYLDRPNSVMLAPSFERGIDLPDDKCRVQIIAKVPFPNLGDPVISERFHSRGGKQWFDVETIRALVQMCGRGVRHANDTCDTFVVDATFKALWKRQQRLFPKWFREAVVIDRRRPAAVPLVEAMKQRREQWWGVR